MDNKPKTTLLCSVCDMNIAEAGGLVCDHHFCHQCFKRFIDGSLPELRHQLRCCVCGVQTTLTLETQGECPLVSFGRDMEYGLADATGLAVLEENGCYVAADNDRKRVYVTDACGDVIIDFAYVHGMMAMEGVAFTSEGWVAMPFQNGTHSLIGYFAVDPAGSTGCSDDDRTTSSTSLRPILPAGYVFATYLPAGAQITALAASRKGGILAADAKHGKIYIINTSHQISAAITLTKLREERHDPEPAGVAVSLENDVIVSDSANHSLRFYDLNGNLKMKLGKEGERPGEYRNPMGVCVEEDTGRIIVADRGNHRAQLLSPDGSFRRYVVRYNRGRDVYMAPRHVVSLTGSEVAVMLTSTQDARAAEVRVYTTTGPQM